MICSSGCISIIIKPVSKLILPIPIGTSKWDSEDSWLQDYICARVASIYSPSTNPAGRHATIHICCICWYRNNRSWDIEICPTIDISIVNNCTYWDCIHKSSRKRLYSGKSNNDCRSWINKVVVYNANLRFISWISTYIE